MATLATNTAARRLHKEEAVAAVALSSNRGGGEPQYTITVVLDTGGHVCLRMGHTEYVDLLTRGVRMAARWQGTSPEDVVR